MKTFAGGIIWAAIFTCYCASASDTRDGEHVGNPHVKVPQQDDLPMDGAEYQMVKRAWNSMPQGGWGKRAWKNMGAVWGKRLADYGGADKRAWQKLQSGWGKRFGPDEEWSLAAENGENDPQYDDYAAPPSGGDFDDLMDEEKRAWRALNSGWGKRAANHDWSSFRGSWGKRDPAWNNLKGLWGKRSIQDRISS